MTLRGLLVLVLSLYAVPAYAGLTTATGTFTFSNGTGSQKITDAACVSPKVVLAWWNRSTADATFSASPGFGFGAAVDRATDQIFDAGFFDLDNVATTDSAYYKGITFIDNAANGTPGFNSSATMTSFDSDGFTINKTTNDNANAQIVHYLCLGGTDIVDAYLGEFGLTTGTGSQSFTGVGFQGNLAIFFGGRFSATGATTGTDFAFHLGAANSTQQAALAVYGDDNTGSASRQESYMDNGVAIAIAAGGGPGVQLTASFTSFDADGFTVNKTANAEGVTRYTMALILKGTFQSHVGSQARPTSTGNQTITTNFTPSAVLIAGTFATANATETTQMHLSVGAGATTSTENGLWVGDAASINTDTNQYSSSSQIYTQATNPSTVAAQASLNAMLSTGPQLNWGTADGNARLFFDITLGAASRRSVSPILFQ